MMAVTSAAVSGPMVPAQRMMREGDHSRCFWWAAGMCSARVVCRPGSSLRRWLATRSPRQNASTVVAVNRMSSVSWISAWGAE
jgi:hypothetical protein